MNLYGLNSQYINIYKITWSSSEMKKQNISYILLHVVLKVRSGLLVMQTSERIGHSIGMTSVISLFGKVTG